MSNPLTQLGFNLLEEFQHWLDDLTSDAVEIHNNLDLGAIASTASITSTETDLVQIEQMEAGWVGLEQWLTSGLEAPDWATKSEQLFGNPQPLATVPEPHQNGNSAPKTAYFSTTEPALETKLSSPDFLQTPTTSPTSATLLPLNPPSAVSQPSSYSSTISSSSSQSLSPPTISRSSPQADLLPAKLPSKTSPSEAQGAGEYLAAVPEFSSPEAIAGSTQKSRGNGIESASVEQSSRDKPNFDSHVFAAAENPDLETLQPAPKLKSSRFIQATVLDGKINLKGEITSSTTIPAQSNPVVAARAIAQSPVFSPDSPTDLSSSAQGLKELAKLLQQSSFSDALLEDATDNSEIDEQLFDHLIQEQVSNGGLQPNQPPDHWNEFSQPILASQDQSQTQSAVSIQSSQADLWDHHSPTSLSASFSASQISQQVAMGDRSPSFPNHPSDEHQFPPQSPQLPPPELDDLALETILTAVEQQVNREYIRFYGQLNDQ